MLRLINQKARTIFRLLGKLGRGIGLPLGVKIGVLGVLHGRSRRLADISDGAEKKTNTSVSQINHLFNAEMIDFCIECYTFMNVV